jgi:hypothetical protein
MNLFSEEIRTGRDQLSKPADLAAYVWPPKVRRSRYSSELPSGWNVD